MRFALAVLFCAAACLAQTPVWQSTRTITSGWVRVASFSDYDHDGCDDILAGFVANLSNLSQYVERLQIVSGRNGDVLHWVDMTLNDRFGAAGDRDGDGYGEIVMGIPGYVYFYSPRSRSWSSVISGSASGNFGEATEPIIDLDGDGLLDLVTATTASFDSTLYAYGHDGVLRYTIPASVHGFRVRSIAAVGDLDGDRGCDYVVGVGGFGGRGGAVLVSGRSGTVLRAHQGDQPGDFLGNPVHGTADMDGDGVPDYAASTTRDYGAMYVKVWSGATGALIRHFPVDAWDFFATRDVDHDGLADLVSAELYFNNPAPRGPGRISVLSARDGRLLYETHMPSWGAGYGNSLADLGMQPGSDYPSYAVLGIDVVSPYGFIHAWRCQPPETAISGTGCSSVGTVPTIGLSNLPSATRINLGGGVPGALAWCMLGDGSATSCSGLPLPIALDPLGMPSCELLVPVGAAGATFVGSSGIDRGFASFDIPQAINRRGLPWAAQWLLLDPITGAFATTPRHDFRLQ